MRVRWQTHVARRHDNEALAVRLPLRTALGLAAGENKRRAIDECD
jgi:hypothetical protein